MVRGLLVAELQFAVLSSVCLLRRTVSPSVFSEAHTKGDMHRTAALDGLNQESQTAIKHEKPFVSALSTQASSGYRVSHPLPLENLLAGNVGH